jgi:uncharacterized protein (TIGR03437 family)
MNAPLRHTSWSVLTRLLLLALSASSLFAANPSIALQISSETAPAGGTAQFKIFVTPPALVSTASISMTFDPNFFGPILNVAAFSATGDQAGYANVNGQQLTASVSSSSASLGQLPDLPIFVVTVQLLPGPPPPTPPAGASVSDQLPGYPSASVTVDPTQSPWQDQQGNTYTVNVNPGTLTVRGSLSIQSVTPGGGFLPSGTVVTINGTGFDASTTAAIDGVSIASTQFVSAQQINVTLGGATELTGKHLHVTTAVGLQSDFFCSLPSIPANVTSNLFLFLPLATYGDVSWDVPDSPDYGESIALLNQNPYPANVTFFSTDPGGIVTLTSEVIPPGQLYLYDPRQFDPSDVNDLGMLPSAPLRMLEFRANNGSVFGPSQMSVFPPGLLGANYLNLLQPTVSPSAAPWTWQVGAPAPSPMTVSIRGSFPFTAASSVPWVTVSPTQGTEPATLTLTPNVSALTAGSYSGSVTIHNTVPTALSPFVQDTVIPVTMQVGATSFITVEGPGPVSVPAGSTTPVTATFSVSTAGAQASIAVAVSVNSGNWLSATPTTGFAPGTVTFTVNPTGLANGAYSGIIVVYGPLNHIIVPVQINVGLNLPPQAANPSTLTFALAAGTAALGTTPVILSQNYATISVATQSGGNWLSATLPIKDEVLASASAVGLSPGTYQGTITLNPGSLQVPVILTVLTPSAPLTVTPASVSLISVAGQSVTQTFNVNSSPSTLFSLNVSTPGPEQWNTGRLASSPYTPSTVTLTFNSSQPGIHKGSAIFTSGSNTVTIPIVLTVLATSTSAPILGSVVSAASGLPGPIAPGELIAIYGTGLGYFLGFTIGKGGGCCPYTTVQINGGTAIQTYTSSSQINVIVPSGTPSDGTATLQVFTLGSPPTATWQIPLAPSAPSIFTLSGSGVGPGAIVNQDGSINSPSNPASRGTAIQIYATGAGAPVTLTIGGVNAQVLYAGNAPGEVVGLVQVNAIIPQTAPTGNVPVLLTIGGVTSQLGVTVSIF